MAPAIVTIKLSFEQRSNLLMLLQRCDLKGSEVPAYMDLVETIAKAPVFKPEVKEEAKDDTGSSDPKLDVQ